MVMKNECRLISSAPSGPDPGQKSGSKYIRIDQNGFIAMSATEKLQRKYKETK